MSKKDKEDVKENSSSSSESDESKVETQEDDKDKNFAKLREKVETLEEENESLREQVGSKSERSLDGEANIDEVEKVVFNRDKKKAIRKFNSDKEISDEEWKSFRDKVKLTGEEDDELIYQKMEDAYNTLPSVREQREKELIEKGKKEAMSQFTDQEVDIGSGGDVSGETSKKVRLNAKEKRFAKSMGVDEEDISEAVEE